MERIDFNIFVIPAITPVGGCAYRRKAGIQDFIRKFNPWIPACAGMTIRKN